MTASLLIGLGTVHCSLPQSIGNLSRNRSSSVTPLSGETSIATLLHGSAQGLLSSTNSPLFLHPTRLDTVALATEAAGTPVGRRRFAPFGSPLPSSASLTERGFTDQELDESVGLLHFTYRSMDPTTGRWTSPDPLFARFSPKSLARHKEAITAFAYVHNDPIGATDPTGLARQTLGKSTVKQTVMGAPRARTGIRGALGRLTGSARKPVKRQIDTIVTNYAQVGSGTYYHVTSRDNVQSILQTGLRTDYGGSDKGSSSGTGNRTTGSKETSKGHVYFWENKSQAKRYAKMGNVDNPVLLELNIPHGSRFQADPEMASPTGDAKSGAFRSSTSVGPENISVGRFEPRGR